MCFCVYRCSNAVAKLITVFVIMVVRMVNRRWSLKMKWQMITSHYSLSFDLNEYDHLIIISTISCLSTCHNVKRKAMITLA